MKRMMMAAMLSLASFGVAHAELAWQAAPPADPAQAALQAEQVRAGGGEVPASDASFGKQQAAQYSQNPGE